MNDDLLTKEQRFTRIHNFIDRIPSLSTTVTKVLEVCNRPDTSPKDLNQVISLDPVLTGQVLKLINSAYYSLPNRITSLTRAIIMLGLNTVKNLALSTAILGTMKKAGPFQSLSMDLFWTHSICVGVTAKALAAKRNASGLLREESFVAGLLHDLGKIVLNNCFPGQYEQVLQTTRAGQGPLHEAETRAFGFNHGLAGRMVADKWQLNESLIEALCCHHEPELTAEENRELVSIVALANAYANIYDFGSAGDPYQEYSRIENILEMLDIKWKDLAFLNETVQEEIEKARVFLQVAKGGNWK